MSKTEGFVVLLIDCPVYYQRIKTLKNRCLQHSFKQKSYPSYRHAVYTSNIHCNVTGGI